MRLCAAILERTARAGLKQWRSENTGRSDKESRQRATRRAGLRRGTVGHFHRIDAWFARRDRRRDQAVSAVLAGRNPRPLPQPNRPPQRTDVKLPALHPDIHWRTGGSARWIDVQVAGLVGVRTTIRAHAGWAAIATVAARRPGAGIATEPEGAGIVGRIAGRLAPLQAQRRTGIGVANLVGQALAAGRIRHRQRIELRRAIADQTRLGIARRCQVPGPAVRLGCRGSGTASRQYEQPNDPNQPAPLKPAGEVSGVVSRGWLGNTPRHSATNDHLIFPSLSAALSLLRCDTADIEMQTAGDLMIFQGSDHSAHRGPMKADRAGPIFIDRPASRIYFKW